MIVGEVEGVACRGAELEESVCGAGEEVSEEEDGGEGGSIPDAIATTKLSHGNVLAGFQSDHGGTGEAAARQSLIVWAGRDVQGQIRIVRRRGSLCRENNWFGGRPNIEFRVHCW